MTYPIYRKSAYIKGIHYKIIGENTIITNNHGQLSTNRFAKYTIIELLANEYGDYAVSNEQEWNDSLPQDEGLRIAGNTIYDTTNPVLRGMYESDKADDLHKVMDELNQA